MPKKKRGRLTSRKRAADNGGGKRQLKLMVAVDAADAAIAGLSGSGGSVSDDSDSRDVQSGCSTIGTRSVTRWKSRMLYAQWWQRTLDGEW